MLREHDSTATRRDAIIDRQRDRLTSDRPRRAMHHSIIASRREIAPQLRDCRFLALQLSTVVPVISGERRAQRKRIYG